MNYPTNNQTADSTKDQNRRIFVSNDRVWQTDEQPEDQPDQPAGPGRQLHATDNEADGEAAGKRAQKRRGLVGEGHWYHQGHIERTKHQAAD